MVLMIWGKNLWHNATWTLMLMAMTAAAAPLSSSSAGEVDQVDEAVRSWAQSWDSGDVSQYLDHYADNFIPADGLSRAQWEQQRRSRLKNSAIRHVILRNVRVDVHADTARAQFIQHYLDMDLMSTARKHLTLVKQAGAWKIREEHVEAERMVRR